MRYRCDQWCRAEARCSFHPKTDRYYKCSDSFQVFHSQLAFHVRSNLIRWMHEYKAMRSDSLRHRNADDRYMNMSLCVLGVFRHSSMGSRRSRPSTVELFDNFHQRIQTCKRKNSFPLFQLPVHRCYILNYLDRRCISLEHHSAGQNSRLQTYSCIRNVNPNRSPCQNFYKAYRTLHADIVPRSCTLFLYNLVGTPGTQSEIALSPHY